MSVHPRPGYAAKVFDTGGWTDIVRPPPLLFSLKEDFVHRVPFLCFHLKLEMNKCVGGGPSGEHLADTRPDRTRPDQTPPESTHSQSERDRVSDTRGNT